MFSASKLLVSRAEVSVDVYLLTGATLLALAKFIYYLNGFKTTALEKKGFDAHICSKLFVGNLKCWVNKDSC